jgi:DNA polymerase III alpha subunit
MHLDKFKNPIFDDSDIFKFLYEGNISEISELMVAQSPTIIQFQEITEMEFNSPVFTCEDIDSFDQRYQAQWFMPVSYYELDMLAYCLDKCTTDKQRVRVLDEFSEFEQRKLGTLLKWLKYFVDTCLENNIVWGVGRGSSVASFVLYLIGVHRIDSIKYSLDWREFLR